jgi:hypothetical protein
LGPGGQHIDGPGGTMAKKEVAVSLAYILWIVVVVLVVLWLLGFLVAHISSGLIHLLLLIALIVILYNLFVGRRSAV